MTQATPYTRSTGFADDERNNAGGRSTVRTAQLDAELDAIAVPLDLTIANLSLLQRDDGVMRDGSVPATALGSDTLKLLTTGTATVRGAWLTATSYALKDLVTQSGNTYICAVVHTSGTFATDLAAVKWVLFQIGANPAAGAIPFSPTANITSTNVQSAIVEVDTKARALITGAATTLAATTLTTDGAGGIGFLYSLLYGAGTIGKWLKDLSNAAGAGFIGFLQTGTGAVLRTLLSKLFDFPITPQDFGAVGDGATDDSAAFLAALVAAGPADKTVWVPPTANGYLLKQAPTLGQSGGARMVGLGKVTLKMSTIGAAIDCLTMDGGATKRQVQLENFLIDCLLCGRDGIALTSSNRPIIKNVEIRNTVRDGLAMSCGTGQWLEKGSIDLTVQTAGRHGVSAFLSGSDGAFINEMVFNLLEIRGVGKTVNGGQAINWSSTASGGASKFSEWQFSHVEFDAQYLTGQAFTPSIHCMTLSSGTLEIPQWLSGTFENTGTGSISGGYILQFSGGSLVGLSAENCITNSSWGNLGIDPAALLPANKTKFDNVSQGVNYERGQQLAPGNSRASCYLTASQSAVTGEGTVYYTHSSGATIIKDNTGDMSATGVYTCPVTGWYRAGEVQTQTGLTALNTSALGGVRIGSGALGGNHYFGQSTGANRDAGNNVTLSGSRLFYLTAGTQLWSISTASGNASKNVGVSGGFNTTTVFEVELVG